MLKKISIKTKIVIIATLIFLLVLGGLFLLFYYDEDRVNSRREKLMTELTEEYYNAYIKGRIFGINKQKITLETLKKNTKKDIGILEKCDKDSYAYIIVFNSSEARIKKIEHTIETHLNCQKK